MRVFVTGGTGLVGSLLVKKLRDRGDQVTLLTRHRESADRVGGGCTVVVGDPAQQGPWMESVANCDAVVHLAGEGIFNRRWSQPFKDQLTSSRINSTDNIVKALGKAPVNHAPGSATNTRVLVNASAIGFYGPHGDEELTEESGSGSDFLAKLCVEWERTAQIAFVHRVRVVLLRTGIVLAANGGALAKMLTPFKLFVGGPIGSGKQYMSWIHNEDEVGLILFALDHPELSGPLNATAPAPVTNKDFSRALGSVLGRPSFMPTPGFALRVMLGESANIITSGQRVLPRKALAAGYKFQFPTVDAALRDLLK